MLNQLNQLCPIVRAYCELHGHIGAIVDVNVIEWTHVVI